MSDGVRTHERLSPPLASASGTDRLAWYAGVARWAPSKHNAQPWRFVVADGCLSVWGDPARSLPDTDPQRRELTLSCGAALQLACVAAVAAGHRPQVRLLPDGRGGPLAQLVETGEVLPTDDDRALLAAIPRRRTDRGPLDAQALSPDLPFLLQGEAARLGAGLRLVTTPGDRSTLADIVARADRALVQRPGVDAEVARWSRDPADGRRDGVPVDHTRGPAASYRAEFVQRDFSVPGTPSEQDRAGEDRALVGVLHTHGDTPEDWLTAGRALAAVLLRATVAGANASYVNQPVEHVPSRALLQERLSVPGLPQLVLRIGAGDTGIAPPPRRGASDVLLSPPPGE